MLKFHAECIECLARSNLQKANALPDPRDRIRCAQGICRILSEMDPAHDSAPVASAHIYRLFEEITGAAEDYTRIKHDFNTLMLSMYEELQARIAARPDPLYAAMQLSCAGNYIDFGVFSEVSTDHLRKLLDEAFSYELDREEYAHLRRDLQNGATCAVLHDNCGEVVLDKLMIAELRRAFPHIQITSVVRGGPTINDVTMEDAREVGLFEVAEVMSNGVTGMPGTELSLLPQDVREFLASRDVLIAKGQGNFETLPDCGMNVYFLLLAKCAHYAEWYGIPHLSSALANARRLQAQRA